MTNSSSVEHSQRTIALQSALLWVEGMIRRTEQGPIGLKSKIGSSKSFGVGAACPLSRPIADKLAALNWLLSLNWSLTFNELLTVSYLFALSWLLNLRIAQFCQTHRRLR